MTKTNMAYFNAAKAVSELSDHRQHKLGCVIVDGHKIVSSGCNSHSRTHSIQAKIDSKRFGCTCPGYRHAEVDALIPLIQRGADLSKASIYVYRQHKNGNPAVARPCCGCEQLIKECGIKKVFYSIDNGFAQEKW